MLPILPPILVFCLALAPSSAPPAQKKAKSVEPPTVSQTEVDAAIERGSAWLLKTLGTQGVGTWGGRPGALALVWYTLLESGVPADSEEFEPLRKALTLDRFIHTYDTSIWILALAKDDGLRNFAKIRDATTVLLEWQEKGGDWGYPHNPDLSNTQFAALGLWKAAHLGVKIPPWVWRDLAEGVLRYAAKDGGFGYRPNGQSTMSMTAAGVGTLALCEKELRAAGELDDKFAKRLLHGRSDGMRWLIKAFDNGVSVNRLGSWSLYALYGIERVGAFAGLNWIGDHDWYAVGASSILAAQASDGSWSNDTPGTCFALLFLKRATAMDRPGIAFTGADRPKRVEAGPSHAVCWLRADGDGPVRVGVDHWKWPALRAFERSGERGKGPRIERVDYVVDGDTAMVVLADGQRAMGNARYRVDLWFDRPGVVEVKARFHVRPDDKGELITLESAPLQVEVRHAVPERVSQLGGAFGRNLMRNNSKLTASSVHTGNKGLPRKRYSPERVIDGDPATAWFSREGDKKRSLIVRLYKPVMAGAVVIYPPRVKGMAPEQIALPDLIEVLINDDQQHALILGRDQPAVLDLPTPIEIKKLQIRLVHVKAGSDSSAGGIGEIGLYGPLR